MTFEFVCWRWVQLARHIVGTAAFGLACLALPGAQAASTSILFIGNSFTFGEGSAVRFYRADSVTDLNGQGQGGVPALFKSFAQQAGLDYQVYLETQPGSGLDWHLVHKRATLGQRPWDSVVMHGFSTLDPNKPGDPSLLIRSVRQMAELLRQRNPSVELRLLATWPRADQTYKPTGAWAGQPIEAMARDVRAGYEQAAANLPAKATVVPVGEAWVRAMQTGLADDNPYDGIAAGKFNLWAKDGYHASAQGSYLAALVLFGSLSGRDPRSLGAMECSGFELGLSPAQVQGLQQVAFDQLAAAGPITPAPRRQSKPAEAVRCLSSR